MSDGTTPKKPTAAPGNGHPGDPPPDADPTGAPKPKPDMASLMLELARIRQEVEGMSEPKKGFGARGWIVAAVLAAALLWWLMR